MVRITIVGGGSYQWVPKLLVDFANTPAMHEAQFVLYDVDPVPLPGMVQLGQRIAKLRSLDWEVSSTTDRAAALDGPDFVIVAISVGGLESMRHDLEIPARYGLAQPVGDSVGPGGIMRSLRSVPVVVGLARAMERSCPSAVLLNLSNPLTALCRGVTRETSIRTIGLCNELVGLQFVASLLLDAGLHEIDLTVAGVNHLPLVTEMRVGERDGFALLRELLDHRDDRGGEPIWMDLDGVIEGYTKRSTGEHWTKADVLANNPVKFELFEQFGALPGSHDDHVAEFFSNFGASVGGREWAVHTKGLPYFIRERDDAHRHYEELVRADEVPPWPSGELVAPVLDALLGGMPKNLPVNLANSGQVADLPIGAVVEAMATIDAEGARPRDHVEVGGWLGAHLRRISASQELTVDAALTGDRTRVLEAMLTDPFVGHLPFDDLRTMTDELLAATAPWLPQFS